jgi:hypothetical protein
MEELMLKWKYFEDTKALQAYRNSLNDDRDLAGLYLCIFKHRTNPRVMYVGESSKLWARNMNHFEESVAGRWMMYLWGKVGEDDDYGTRLKKYISERKYAGIDLKCVDFGKRPWTQSVTDDILNITKIEKRITYMNTHLAFAFATSTNEEELAETEWRLAAEALLITKLREMYAKEGIKGFGEGSRPDDIVVGGIKKFKRIDTVKLSHRGDINVPGFPPQVSSITKYN